MEKRNERCGTTCKLNEDNVDHCAYCRVEENIGPYGWELPKPDSSELEHTRDERFTMAQTLSFEVARLPEVRDGEEIRYFLLQVGYFHTEHNGLAKDVDHLMPHFVEEAIMSLQSIQTTIDAYAEAEGLL